MFYFHIWYRNLQNFSLTREESNKNMKTLKGNSVFDTNFLRFLEFLKTLKLCFQRDWESFFCMNLILMLRVFTNLYCVATAEVVSGPSSIANLGLFRKLKVQFRYWWLNSNWICKCKPTISTRAVFDIPSALQ